MRRDSKTGEVKAQNAGSGGPTIRITACDVLPSEVEIVKRGRILNDGRLGLVANTHIHILDWPLTGKGFRIEFEGLEFDDYQMDILDVPIRGILVTDTNTELLLYRDDNHSGPDGGYRFACYSYGNQIGAWRITNSLFIRDESTLVYKTTSSPTNYSIKKGKEFNLDEMKVPSDDALFPCSQNELAVSTDNHTIEHWMMEGDVWKRKSTVKVDYNCNGKSTVIRNKKKFTILVNGSPKRLAHFDLDNLTDVVTKEVDYSHIVPVPLSHFAVSLSGGKIAMHNVETSEFFLEEPEQLPVGEWMTAWPTVPRTITFGNHFFVLDPPYALYLQLLAAILTRDTSNIVFSYLFFAESPYPLSTTPSTKYPRLFRAMREDFPLITYANGSIPVPLITQRH